MVLALTLAILEVQLVWTLVIVLQQVELVPALKAMKMILLKQELRNKLISYLIDEGFLPFKKDETTT